MIFTPEEQQQINDTFAMMQEKITEWAKRKGWTIPDSFGDVCTLFTSEIIEAYEEHREHRADDEVWFNEKEALPRSFGLPSLPDQLVAKPEGIPIEFGDLGIRMLHWFGDHPGMNLGNCIVMKMDYNDLRPHRHGGKKV
jgi:hypothetical protein